jgi:NCAIR mutase (PurE)-related protein
LRPVQQKLLVGGLGVARCYLRLLLEAHGTAPQQYPVASISSLTPSTVAAGITSAPVIFLPTSTAGGSNLATTYRGSTQLSLQLTDADQATAENLPTRASLRSERNAIAA